MCYDSRFALLLLAIRSRMNDMDPVSLERPPRHPLRLTTLVALVIGGGLAVMLAAEQTPAPQPPAVGPAGRPVTVLPEDDPEFVQLIEKLTERSALYRKYALGFTCREIVKVSDYDLDTSGFKKNTRTVYDYLFEEKESGGLRELREEVVETKGGVKHKGTDFEAPLPPAYSWATIFSPENRGRFHFRPVGQVVKAYRLLTVIDFVGVSPNPGGGDISGWSGQLAIDSRSLNLWSVDAVPSGQELRLKAAITKYQRAFAIAGVPLAQRPNGWSLNVVFGMELNSLSYPTEQTLSKNSLARAGKMGLDQKTLFRYEEYRFFKVATGEEIKGTETPEKP